MGTTKTKTTKKTTSSKAKTKPENLCVFAFRLMPEERDAIHKAAGPARASKFVRAVAIAAARVASPTALK